MTKATASPPPRARAAPSAALSAGESSSAPPLRHEGKRRPRRRRHWHRYKKSSTMVAFTFCGRVVSALQSEAAAIRPRGRRRTPKNHARRQAAGGGTIAAAALSGRSGRTTTTALSDLSEALLEQIFLRLPPEEGRAWRHIRASLVCRSWRRIISDDSGFLRRYFARHRERILAQEDAARREQDEARHRLALELLALERR